MSQQFCLKWNSHMTNMMDVFKSLLSTESMVDCTLACDGLSLKAHKIVLSACSPFFQALFLENPCKHPIVILKDMKYTELKAIIEFMYHGEVNVGQDQLSALMKTAETLRVKGLAEVTNEKNSQSNASGDEPSHRSVPRTETPPPSKRRRRTRKRSLSDSNRSDDESNEPKVKQPMSPDIEELSGDHTMEATSGHFSSIQSQVPMQQMPSHSTNSFQRTNVAQDSPHVEEPTSADESEFGVEPAKLLEQTLTTDDLANARRGRSSAQSGMEMQRRSRSTDHSTSLVPTSMPSDSYSSSMNQQLESPPDIKPELLDLDPPISPVPGPSHSADNSMMFDQSSVSSHPGTSYQDNSGALVPQDSSPQETFTCDKCEHVLTSKEALSRHQARHRSDTTEKRHRCTLCSYATHYSSHLKQHMFTHSGERPFKCTACKAGFTQNWHLRKHMLTVHGEDALPPPSDPKQQLKCTKCSEVFPDSKQLQKHEKIHRKEEKPFRCGYCPKRFPRSNSLRRHEKRHLENKDPPLKRSKEVDVDGKESPQKVHKSPDKTSLKIREKSPEQSPEELPEKNTKTHDKFFEKKQKVQENSSDVIKSQKNPEKSPDVTKPQKSPEKSPDVTKPQKSPEKSPDVTKPQKSPEKSLDRENSEEKVSVDSSVKNQAGSESDQKKMKKRDKTQSPKESDGQSLVESEKSNKSKSASRKTTSSKEKDKSIGVKKDQLRPPSPEDMQDKTESDLPRSVSENPSASAEKVADNPKNRPKSPVKDDLNLPTEHKEELDYFEKLSSSSEKDFIEPSRSWKADRPKSPHIPTSRDDSPLLARDRFRERQDKPLSQQEKELSMPIIWTDSPRSPSPMEKGNHLIMTEKGKSETLASLTDKYSRKDSYRDKHRHFPRDFSHSSEKFKASSHSSHSDRDSSRSGKDRRKSTGSRDSHSDKEKAESSSMKGKSYSRDRSRSHDRDRKDRPSSSHWDRPSERKSDLLRGRSSDREKRPEVHKERSSRSEKEKGHSSKSAESHHRHSSSHKERLSRSYTKDVMSPSRRPKSPAHGEDGKATGKTKESLASDRQKSPPEDFKPPN